MKKGSIGIGIGIILLLLIIGQHFGFQWPTSLSPSCSLGVYGTAASVTLTGASAQDDCQSLITTSIGTNGKTVFYQMTEPATGIVLCEGTTQNGNHYLVRDTGVMNLVGTDLCRWMLGPTPGFEQSSVPTPTPTPPPTPPPAASATVPAGTDTCAIGVSGHDAVLWVVDTDGSGSATMTCNQLLTQQSYYDIVTIPTDTSLSWGSLPVVCSQVQGKVTITVYDDGGKYYGGIMCQELGLKS